MARKIEYRTVYARREPAQGFDSVFRSHGMYGVVFYDDYFCIDRITSFSHCYGPRPGAMQFETANRYEIVRYSLIWLPDIHPSKVEPSGVQYKGFNADRFKYFRSKGKPAALAALYSLTEKKEKHESISQHHAWCNQPFEHLGHKMRFIDNPKACGLRLAGYVELNNRENFNKLTSSGGTAYCCDDEGFRLVYPVVYQMPARKGRALLIPGYQEFDGKTPSGGVCLAFDSVVEAERIRGRWDSSRYSDVAYDYEAVLDKAQKEAANIACEIAEALAEDERAYHYYHDFGRDVARLRGEMSDIRKSLLADILKAKSLKTKPARKRALDRVRSEIESAWDELCDMRGKIRELFNDYDHSEAFHNGIADGY